ncbi:MAG: hypothetical protein Q7T10_11155 [Rhodoferax sp.]|uniref:hypothetical protein n=1 Tax=Rhodoferax sp. TaxID=50421 RepID=UPI002728B1D8|nr:hypothetical protein [Rhodoferax sp.]MDO8449349.1 hypothetical protein [Rhodoferax sp.]
MFTDRPDAVTLARLHDEAKAEAVRLRREAIDDFWRGANAVWQRCVETGQATAERSAARWKARLIRRTHERTGSAPTPNPTVHSGV